MWYTTKQPIPHKQQELQVYNIPTSMVTPNPIVQPVKQNNSWRILNRKNKPQSNSVGVGSLIFISGGMNMAWRLGFSSFDTLDITRHLILSWFIGSIIGVVIGALICNYIPKKIIMCFASILVTITGILQAFEPNSYDYILTSRYLNGIAVGLVFPMTFVLIGEEVVKEIRGMNAATIDTLCFSCGIFIQIIYSTSWKSSNDAYPSIRRSGLLNIIYGIIAFIMALLMLIESPIVYLASGKEEMAIDILRRLQRPCTITDETLEQLEEHKRYLAENKERTFIENAIYGLPALLKLGFYRAFAALGLSYFVNFAFTISTAESSLSEVYPYILYGLARWLGPLIISFTMDSKGRKAPMIIGFLLCTVFAFIVGFIFNDNSNLHNIYYMNATKYILIFFQLFSSIGMTSSSAYLSEAFPLAVKPYYIAMVFIIEMLVHILTILLTPTFLKSIDMISVYFFTYGALVFLVVAVCVMPETKRYSLRECLIKFRN